MNHMLCFKNLLESSETNCVLCRENFSSFSSCDSFNKITYRQSEESARVVRTLSLGTQLDYTSIHWHYIQWYSSHIYLFSNIQKAIYTNFLISHESSVNLDHLAKNISTTKPILVTVIGGGGGHSGLWHGPLVKLCPIYVNISF